MEVEVTSTSALELVAKNIVDLTVGVQKLNEAQQASNSMSGISVAVLIVIVAILIGMALYKIINSVVNKSVF